MRQTVSAERIKGCDEALGSEANEKEQFPIEQDRETAEDGGSGLEVQRSNRLLIGRGVRGKLWACLSV